MLILNYFLKFLFLMTPFFVLSMFLSMTAGWSSEHKKALALKVGVAVFSTCVVLLFFGQWIFDAFDITLDAFRIGGGAMLFLSAVGLVSGNVTDKRQQQMPTAQAEVSNIAVVPLALPVTVGPGTIGALLVFGVEAGTSDRLWCVIALALATVVVTVMLRASAWCEEKLGLNVIIIFSKITGLVLAAMAAQMVFTGIKNFLFAA